MSLPSWSPLARHRPLHELSREDTGSVSAAARWNATLVTADGRLVRQLQAAGWTGRVRSLGA